MNIRLFTLPNMLTLANLVAGAIAITLTLRFHAYESAFWLIIAAAVCDFFDGFAARLLKQSSPLGVQLDSLADDISFGLAPAVVMFDMYGQSTSYYNLSADIIEPLGYVTLIIAAFSALRLAKFNIDTTQSTEFAGLPTPANAMMLMSLAVLAEQGHVALYQEHIALISVAAALLLISPIRMFALKFKGFGIKGNELRYAFMLLSLIIIIAVPAYSVLAIIVIYIALSTVRWLFSRS
ncbi:MAG: CDP-diacylglycerol--serine O-phosphatidyltransferase [Rikenellaceae bacterium]|nr:CDP-diacylglycerol--serine O-phosphatidyltransferase [Rikenellaceae bacterium]